MRCVVCCLALLAACTSQGRKPAKDSEPPRGGTVKVGLSELGPLDPAQAKGPSSLAVLRAACDGVTALDPDSGKPEPALAKSWSFKEGAQKLTIQLRQGMRFSDGTRVDSQSIRESLSRVARPAASSPWSHLVTRVAGFSEVQSGAATHLSGVKTLSRKHLEIELTQPFSDLPTVLAHPGLTPVSLKWLAAAGNAPEIPVCSGPYEINVVQPGKEYRLVRPGGKRKAGVPAAAEGRRAPADVIAVKAFDSPQDAYAAFQKGEIDVVRVPEASIAEVQARTGFDRQPGPQIALLAFDAAKPPTDDIAIRRAISLAVDRLVLIDAAFPDQRPPALRWLPPNSSREAGPACDRFIRKVADPEKAKESLGQAGTEAKGPIPLIFDVSQFSRLVVQAIEIQVQDVLGVDLDPQALDAAEFDASLKARPAAGIWLMNTSVELPIPGEIIGDMFASGSPRNVMAFSDPGVDAAIEKARRATSEPEAARLWAEAENEVCDKMPAIPMWRASAHWIRNPARVTIHGDSMLDVSGSPVLRALREAAR